MSIPSPCWVFAVLHVTRYCPAGKSAKDSLHHLPNGNQNNLFDGLLHGETTDIVHKGCLLYKLNDSRNNYARFGSGMMIYKLGWKVASPWKTFHRIYLLVINSRIHVWTKLEVIRRSSFDSDDNKSCVQRGSLLRTKVHTAPTLRLRYDKFLTNPKRLVAVCIAVPYAICHELFGWIQMHAVMV